MGTPLLTSTRYLGCPKVLSSISWWPELVLHAQHNIYPVAGCCKQQEVLHLSALELSGEHNTYHSLREEDWIWSKIQIFFPLQLQNSGCIADTMTSFLTV